MYPDLLHIPMHSDIRMRVLPPEATAWAPLIQGSQDLLQRGQKTLDSHELKTCIKAGAEAVS